MKDELNVDDTKCINCQCKSKGSTIDEFCNMAASTELAKEDFRKEAEAFIKRSAKPIGL